MDWWKNLIQKLNKYVPTSFRRLLHPEHEAMLAESAPSEAVLVLRKRIKMQAMMALAAIALILVLVFGMSAAWYTNVAKVSDLTFETEAWGFDSDKISIDSRVQAAPGRSGFVPLTVDNTASTDGVQVGVTFKKQATAENQWQDELQKRIFFYADDGRTYDFSAGGGEPILFRDEATETTEQAVEFVVPTQETVSRIYLGATSEDSCTYTILPGQKLSLSEEYYNDVPLKWMWVYDMLGYYFRGTVDTEGEASLRVDEYIRPIEYDYDHAVFDERKTVESTEQTGTDGAPTVVANPDYGQLTMANGLTRDQFLYQLSASDGYQGVITPEEKPVVIEVGGDETTVMANHWYYPIDVDEEGTGVWAYLCTSQEIEEGFAIDNQLTKAETDASLSATIMLTAVNIPANVHQVTSTEELKASLLDTSTANVVALQNDVTLSEPIQLQENAPKVIDLNGYSLVYSGAESMFDLSDGANLTLMNGGMQSESGSGTAIYAQGSDVTLSNVKITNFTRAVDIQDDTAIAEQVGDTTLRLTGCDVETEEISVMIRGNGTDTEANTKVIIEDCTIHSKGYAAIYGQGNATNAGTELVILNSTISGYWGALYQPQQRAVTTISNSKLSGYTGIVVKGGTVTIIDSEITGTGDYHPATNSPSGYTDTGDGVYVEATYNWSATVLLKGNNKVRSDHAYAVELFGMEGRGPGKIAVYDGSYVGELGSDHWNGIGTFEVYGGLKQEDAAVTPEDPATTTGDTDVPEG